MVHQSDEYRTGPVGTPMQKLLRDILRIAPRAMVVIGFLLIMYGPVVNTCSVKITYWPFSYGTILLSAGSIWWLIDLWPQAIKSWEQSQERRPAVRRWKNVIMALIFFGLVGGYVSFLFLLDYFSNC